mmetsp:Transcript_10448/g.18438  ORF Transcript_10448/g.18438 Transcript_10448/m.18438 type:complete len:221 (-) Transcript_10448:281-943(-)
MPRAGGRCRPTCTHLLPLLLLQIQPPEIVPPHPLAGLEASEHKESGANDGGGVASPRQAHQLRASPTPAPPLAVPHAEGARLLGPLSANAPQQKHTLPDHDCTVAPQHRRGAGPAVDGPPAAGGEIQLVEIVGVRGSLLQAVAPIQEEGVAVRTQGVVAPVRWQVAKARDVLPPAPLHTEGEKVLAVARLVRRSDRAGTAVDVEGCGRVRGPVQDATKHE